MIAKTEGVVAMSRQHPKPKHERVRLLRTDRGHFAPGNPGGPGRRHGSRNVLPIALREAVVIAADELGSNGKGKGGLVGYLKFLGQRHPVAFVGLLGKLLPHEIAATLIEDDPLDLALSLQEMRDRLMKRGIDVDSIFDPPAELLSTGSTNGSDKMH